MGIRTEEMKGVVAQQQVCYGIGHSRRPKTSSQRFDHRPQRRRIGSCRSCVSKEIPQNPPLSQGGDSKVNIRHQGHDR